MRTRTLLIAALAGLLGASVGGCVGGLADGGASRGARVIEVPTRLTGAPARPGAASTLILGVI